MGISYAIVSDKGNREVNEDSVGFAEKDENRLFILCDGLGGHGMGDVASNLVVDVFKTQFQSEVHYDDFMKKAFSASQDILLAEQLVRKAKSKMKTTAVSLLLNEKYAFVGYIGDSRAYVFNKNKLKKRTLDHSIPQMLALSKEIKESEIRNHPDRNIVLRVMGIDWEEPQFELLKPISKKKCQAFLLCSDGFWELIDEDTMLSLLKKATTVNEWLDTMVSVVKENGKNKNMDNFSAIAIWNE